MIRGFYSARSGLIAHQEHMSVMANNLANVNTYGFKPMRTAFTDLMYQNLNRVRNENVAQTGHGVKINKNDIMMNPGALEPTYNRLDFAIIDESGFFKVETQSGAIHYTRAGNFYLSNVDDAYYLVNGNGDFVLDADNERIEVEFNEYTYENENILDEDGNVVDTVTRTVSAYPNEEFMMFDPSVIGVFRFENPWGLDAVHGNSFVETELSGEATAIENPTLKAGYLERAAVDIANEMANVIEASKAFSFSSRMVQVADEIEQTINQLR